jgi:hypothetical protein
MFRDKFNALVAQLDNSDDDMFHLDNRNPDSDDDNNSSDNGNDGDNDNDTGGNGLGPKRVRH